MMPIADLHCDLLLFLSNGKERTPLDPEARCALPQLKKGGVCFQTLAVFTETKPGSSRLGEAQFRIFSKLEKYGFNRLKEMTFPESIKGIHTTVAIENASSLCEEDEPLSLAFERLDRYRKLVGPILYISLTWNSENRFGGGNDSKVGLKKDGQAFLDYLHGKQIALDFSHTSDALAADMLNYIEKNRLQILPIASHSNFRSVHSHLRNLPDDIAKEIAKKGGIIGFNAVYKIVGSPFLSSALRHLEQAAKLGIADQLCFGADFFCIDDLPPSLQLNLPVFDSTFEDASGYPKLLDHFRTLLTEKQIEGMAWKNLADFLNRLNKSVPLCC